MAGRRGKRSALPGVVITPTAGDEEPEDGTAPSAQTADDLARVGDEGQKQPKARIDRYDPVQRAYATLEYVAANEVDGEFIQENYGGGKYMVYFWGTRNDGTYGYLKGKGKEFVIDSSIPFKGAGRRGAVHNPDGSVALPAPTNAERLMDMGLLQIFKGMQDQSAAMAQQNRDHSMAMLTVLEKIAAPRESGVPALLAALVPLLTPLLQGLLNRRDPVEIATEIAKLREPAQKLGGLGELEVLFDVADRLSRMRNPGDDEPTLAGVAKDNLPKILDLGARLMDRRGTTAPDATAPPPAPVPAAPRVPVAAATPPLPATTAPAASPPPAAAEPATPADEWTPVEPYMPYLVEFAETDTDPADAVTTILTIAPPQLRGMIRRLVKQEHPADILTKRFPVLAPHREWVADLLSEFHAEFFGNAEDDPDPPPEPGDAPGADESPVGQV